MDNLLKSVVSAWMSKIRLAMEQKQKAFQNDADEAMRFYASSHDFIYEAKNRKAARAFSVSDDEDMPNPSFRMTVNKVAELVQLFGPTLYARNPVRKVSPRQVPMPPAELFGNTADPNLQMQYMQLMDGVTQLRTMDTARAQLLEAYLNFTPNELDLKSESRNAIDEALIKGMGLLVTQKYQPRGSDMTLIGSFFKSVDDLAIDPDVELRKDAQWIALRSVRPVWQWERDLGLAPGTLADRGNLESFNNQAATEDSTNYNRKRGLTNDLLVCWEIYSKMGVGARLAGVPPALRETLDGFGDYCYLVVCDTVDWPLNLPPDIQESTDPASGQEVLQRLEWPTPFWLDDAWPFTEIVFHEVPRSIWPMSHIKPALGELLFLDWAYSFLAGKIRTTSRDFLACPKGVAEEFKTAILAGKDLTLLEWDSTYGSIKDVLQFIQHQPMNADIFKVIQAVEENFEKRVGLTELAYGMSAHQLRSAQEASVKSQQISIRPDDMANCVEDALSRVARKEGIAARWHLDSQRDIAPPLGPVAAQAWAQLVQSHDPLAVMREYEYRIEAGSAKKPNKDRDVANMQAIVPTLLPFFEQYANTTGNVGPANALITDWCKSIDVDPSKYLLTPLPPPPQINPSQPAPANGQPRSTARPSSSVPQRASA